MGIGKVIAYGSVALDKDNMMEVSTGYTRDEGPITDARALYISKENSLEI